MQPFFKNQYTKVWKTRKINYPPHFSHAYMKESCVL